MPRGRPRKVPVENESASSNPSPPDESFNPALADALNKIAGVIAEQPKRTGDAVHQATKRKENIHSPLISTLNPQGDKDYPRPELKYRKAYIPWEAEPEDFNFEERELLNLVEPGEYWVTRNDNSRVMIRVTVEFHEQSDKPEKIWFTSGDAYGRSVRSLMPPFTTMLREMIGDGAGGVMTMRQREEAVKAGELPISVGS